MAETKTTPKRTTKSPKKTATTKKGVVYLSKEEVLAMRQDIVEQSPWLQLLDSGELEEKHLILLHFYEQEIGIVKHACAHAGVSTHTFYNWKNQNNTFSRIIDELEEQSIDVVESVLKDKALAGDVRALTVYLNARAKSRGYGYHKPETEKVGVEVVGFSFRAVDAESAAVLSAKDGETSKEEVSTSEEGCEVEESSEFQLSE